MDPQQRLFHEFAWEALERRRLRHRALSGGLVGVFAGSSLTFVSPAAAREHGYLRQQSLESLLVDSDKDFLTTNVTYKLNLRGPSVAVQTRCSTSLVAVHMACQSLQAGECDMALAGGVSLCVPGSTRAICTRKARSSRPTATAGRSTRARRHGLRQRRRRRRAASAWRDALEDGDTIHAVIKGAALNNDGSAKVGYTAPSVDGPGARSSRRRRRVGRRRRPRRSRTSKRTAPAPRSAIRSRSRR